MTTTTPKPLTYAQRLSVAAVQANERLHFTDEKRMQAALAEIALDEMNRNPSFAVRVRNRYEELKPERRTSQRITDPKGKPTKTKLVPIKELPGFQLDPARRIDPWFILEYYGTTQLEPALRLQTLANLKQAITVVEERYPGTAPKGKVTKEGAITYIMEYALR